MSYLKHTPFFHKHREHGAEFVDRFGFAAAYTFVGIEVEHRATREAVGIFDVYSQVMIDVQGRDARALIQYLAVNDVDKIGEGGVQYTSLCHEKGGIVDDLTIFRLGNDQFRLCPTPSRVDTVLSWLNRHREGQSVSIINLGNSLAYLSVQGPNSRALLSDMTDCDLSSDALRYFRFRFGDVADVPQTMISRTGHSGELGYELFFPSEYAEHMWDRIFEAGKNLGVTAYGLGALVSLRLEKKYPLYGAYLTEETSPVEAGLGWTVAAQKPDFIGKDVLLSQKAKGPARRLVQLVFEDISLTFDAGAQIRQDGQIVGQVTSAGKGYTLDRALALGYVTSQSFAESEFFEVESSEGDWVLGKLSSKALFDPDKKKISV